MSESWQYVVHDSDAFMTSLLIFKIQRTWLTCRDAGRVSRGNMDTKNAVLLMPLVSPRRPAKQQNNNKHWLFVCTLAGLAAGFSLGLCCGYFSSSPKSTARTAQYLPAPLPQHAIVEEFVYYSQPSHINPVVATLTSREAAVAAVPTVAEVPAAAVTAVAGPALPELPDVALYQTPAAGVSHYHGKYFSQTGQDDLIDELLDMQQGGFFVE